MQDEKTYPYDVFISYRRVAPDQEWVRDQLRPALVKAGLKVFLDVEDSVPGRNLILEMDRAGQESRHVLCVISPEYFEEGRMVGFESLSARLRDPAGRYSSLIPLIVRETELPEWMRGLIHLTWTDPQDYAREWKRLLRALRAPDLNVPPPKSLKAEPQNPSDVFSPTAISHRTGRPFRPTAVGGEAGPRSWHIKKLRNAIYVTAVLIITTFGVLAIRQVFTGGSDTIDVNTEATPQASPQPTIAPTPSSTATPASSPSTSPSRQPTPPRKVNPPQDRQQSPDTGCSPRNRALGRC